MVCHRTTAADVKDGARGATADTNVKKFVYSIHLNIVFVYSLKRAGNKLYRKDMSAYSTTSYEHSRQSRCFLIGPQGFHDVARNLLQPWLGDEHPRRLVHIPLSRRTEVRNHLARQIPKLLFLKGLRPSHEDLECRDDEFYWNRVLLRKGNLLHRIKRRAALEHLALRAGFGIRKFESMGDGKERHPIRDGHRETLLPTKEMSGPDYRLVKSTIDLPLVEEGEQRFELEDRDTVQTNYTACLFWARAVWVFIVIGIADLAMSHKSLAELGGVRGQEVLMYSETSIIDLLNRRRRSQRSTIHQ